MKLITTSTLFLLSLSILAQAINQDVLDQIKEKETATHSDAVIIQQYGKTIYKYLPSEKETPIYIASAGKSLTNLAIGKLLEKGLLDSIDQPVHTIYPQWKQGRKKEITVKMLLNHTSGLQNHPTASIELEPPPDYQIENIIDLALAAEMTEEPGSAVRYNNKAVALLGGIVAELSGKRFDEFFKDEFYDKMDIEEFDWIKDRSGNPTVHGAFVIKPSDFLKFGELMMQKGTYQGQRILNETWVEQSFAQSQEFTPIWGLLWWRLPEYEKRIIDSEIWSSWEDAGVDPAFMTRVLPMKEVLYESKFAFFQALESHLGSNWNHLLNQQLPSHVQSSKRLYSETITAYYADGFRGNYLVIIPESGIVAIRCADSDGFNYQTDFFNDFVSLVSRLTSE